MCEREKKGERERDREREMCVREGERGKSVCGERGIEREKCVCV